MVASHEIPKFPPSSSAFLLRITQICSNSAFDPISKSFLTSTIGSADYRGFNSQNLSFELCIEPAISLLSVETYFAFVASTACFCIDLETNAQHLCFGGI